jgi:hypothetical protein
MYFLIELANVFLPPSYSSEELLRDLRMNCFAAGEIFTDSK